MTHMRSALTGSPTVAQNATRLTCLRTSPVEKPEVLAIPSSLRMK